jgi:type IX secretion system PorP/SprF family membrane protein
MKKTIKTVLFLLVSVCASGQLVPVTNQYILNPMTINPAFAGNRGALNVAAFFRKQWVGIKGAPETETLSADAPVADDKIGLGVMLINDKVGVTNETQLITNYSYKINLSKGTLSFGLGAGLVATNTAWSQLIVLDPGDEQFLADSKMFIIPEFSFGSYYSTQKFFAGFSIPRLVTYKFSFSKNKYVMQTDPSQYNYMFSTGYIFQLSDKVGFIPSTLVTYSPNGGLLADLNGYFILNNKFWAGASYRNGRSLTMLFQIQLSNQLKMAYSYDYDLGQLGTYSNGSHEIMLRYEFKYKVDVVSPLIF